MNDQHKAQDREKPGFFKRYLVKHIIKGAVLVAVVAVVSGFAAVGLEKYLSSDSKTTKIGFEDIGELATQTAYCTEVNVTEAARDLWGVRIPFTQSKYIYSYDVVIKAGFDFGEIEWSVDEEASAIKVALPEVRILSSEIDTDSFKLYHESESLFRQITLEENNEALANLKETAKADAVANGLLENARGNAETILRGFFGNVYDLETYSIEFTDK